MSLAVFPTDDPTVCEDLGLSYPEPLEQDTANEIREIDDELIAYFQAEDCPTIEAAADEVRRILDQVRLTDWTIQKQTRDSTAPLRKPLTSRRIPDRHPDPHPND